MSVDDGRRSQIPERDFDPSTSSMAKTRKPSLLGARTARTLGLEFEISIYEKASEWEPRDEEILDALGHAYTARGRYEKGLEVDQRLTEIDPVNPTYVYNLACSLSLLGRIDESFAALERAIDVGFRDSRLLAADPDLKAVRTDPRFFGLVEKATKLAAS
jgi:tetratricopeptide (TPR) repeat protein